MDAQTFTKHVSEQYIIAIDYTGKGPPLATLDSGTVSARDRVTGIDATDAVLESPTLSMNGMQARAGVRGGVAGVVYRLIFLTNWSDDSVLEDELHMRVVDI